MTTIAFFPPSYLQCDTESLSLSQTKHKFRPLDSKFEHFPKFNAEVSLFCYKIRKKAALRTLDTVVSFHGGKFQNR